MVLLPGIAVPGTYMSKTSWASTNIHSTSSTVSNEERLLLQPPQRKSSASRRGNSNRVITIF